MSLPTFSWAGRQGPASLVVRDDHVLVSDDAGADRVRSHAEAFAQGPFGAPFAVRAAVRRALVAGPIPVGLPPLLERQWRFAQAFVGIGAARVVTIDANHRLLLDDDGLVEESWSQRVGEGWDEVAILGPSSTLLPLQLLAELRQRLIEQRPSSIAVDDIFPLFDRDAVATASFDEATGPGAGVFCRVHRDKLEFGGYEGRDGGSYFRSFERCWQDPESIVRFNPDMRVFVDRVRAALGPAVRR